MHKYDIIFIMPYLFSDHPSFPEGILKRSLEFNGFSVGVIETPFWQKPESFSIYGEPRLFFAIIPGPVDSVVLNYTSLRKRRNEDLYQEKGNAFFDGCPDSIKYKIRPDSTVTVFANCIRRVFKKTPIIIGGIESTLRRFAHYDFQKEQLRRSILLDSRADLMVTGMGEKQIVEIAHKIHEGALPKELDLPGTARVTSDISKYPNYTILPSMEEIQKEPFKLVDASLKIEKAVSSQTGIIQPHEGRYIIEHPAQSYTPADLDTIYGYPYTRLHISSNKLSPALQMNLFSITSHRGCGGGCSFCSISVHEGKKIISRSRESIFREIDSFKKHSQWKGVISDIGGATAELYGSDCHNAICKRHSCFVKELCPTIRSASAYLSLLRQARNTNGVRKIFLGSGIRYDLMAKNPELLEEVLVHHSGKFLRVAPEHTENPVLDLMRKPRFEVFEEFVNQFNRINRNLPRKIELAPYLIIGHPGEEMKDVSLMLNRLKKLNLKTTDVQVFTPTPGTLSTAMYFAGVSVDGKSIPVERKISELMRRKQVLTGFREIGS